MQAICLSAEVLDTLIQGLILPYRRTMDPLSVLASVLAVAGATAQTAKSLYELVDGVRHAPDEIVALSKDTHAFYNIVFSLETSLRDRKISKMVGEEQPLTILVGNLEEPLKNCSAALGRLMVKIQSVVRPLDGERFRMSSNELKWYFMKKEIKELTDQVERTKATLNNAQTNVITYVGSVVKGSKPNSFLEPFERHKSSHGVVIVSCMPELILVANFVD
ncbi:MAG: hypothetical protein Q9190_000635 [Brigantiaea leucoxantha]